MIFYWLGILFLSSGMIFIHPVYGIVESSARMILLAAGTLSVIIGYYRTDIESCINTPFKIILILIPSAYSLFTFSFPYDISFQLISCGVIFLFFLRHKLIRPIGFGIISSGIILSFQTGMTVLYFKLASRFHETVFFNPLFYVLFKILNVPVSCSSNRLFIQSPRAVIELASSWEKLGLYFFLCYLIGGTFIILLTSGNSNRKRIKRFLIFLLILTGYSLIRFTLLSMIFVDSGIIRIFWEPLIVSLSYLPLPFLVTPFISFRPISEPEHNFFCLSKQTFYAGLASFILFFSFSTFFTFQEPGQLKQGRILIDEYYSNWEWTERKLDTKWYGIQSVYNYYNFGEFIRHFYSAETLKEPITAKVLSNYDIFIIKTPTRAFTEKEINAIVSFVSNGGGIFLIGDHTNVFGTTDNLNPLAEKFGISFNYDATYDLRTSDLHFHDHRTLLKHPAVMHMPYFLYATSCTLSAPFLAEDIMTASNLKTMYLDYSRGGYFPDKTEELNYTFGLFLQSAGLKFGKGRMIAFTDSTCFSNFYMHIPGKPEFLIGTLNWLNRKNLYNSRIKTLCSFLMLTAFVFMIIKIKRTDKQNDIFGSAGMILCLGLFGLTLGIAVCSGFNQKSYATPKEHTPFKKIGFENSFCSFRIPDKKLLHRPEIDFHTFYVWTQRLGYVPDVFSLRNSRPDRFDMIILVNPDRPLPDQTIDTLENYIKNGGKILLMTDPLINRPDTNKMLERFGLNIRFDDISEDADIYSGIMKAGTLKTFAVVEGGIPLLYSNNKKVIAAASKKGRGIIAVMACSSSFTNKEMGKTETIPDKHQQFIYRLEFWIIKGLMEQNVEPF